MSKTLLFHGTQEDINFLPHIKSMFVGHKVYVRTENVGTWTELLLYCREKKIEGIVSTNLSLLKRLVLEVEGTPSIDNYAGSFFVRDGIEIVFVNPLKQLVTVSFGRFMMQRYISKILAPEFWVECPATAFQWEVFSPEKEHEYFDFLNSCLAIAMDIETRPDLSISMISYTGIFVNEVKNFETRTVVLPLDDEFALAVMRKWNWELQPPKIFQGGDYDNAYLLAYQAPVHNWLWDTMTMFHCWYCELPKDLAYLGAFLVRECIYWKDMFSSPDKYEQYKYNARDTWTTANVFIRWIHESPEWARRNYQLEFPLMFPNLLAGMTGIRRDFSRLSAVRSQVKERIASAGKWLDKVIGVSNFNTNSPVQMKALLQVLGCKDLPSTDEKNLKKAMFRHPLNAIILGRVLEIRALRKLLSTYLRTDEDADKKGQGGGKEFRGRVLYSIKGHGTETGRNSSKEHYFWTGVNIQNQPSRPTEYVTGKECKSTLMADEGFRFAEVDLEQAESRDTAYCAGEPILIRNVTGDKDFHSLNASSFFGRKYEDIYDDVKRKTKDKALRDLAKRVNHGANYLMGPDVLVDTMGLSKVYEAGRLLGLPSNLSARDIAVILLSNFHRTYPGLSGVYYPAVTTEVMMTRMLVGATGWTRYCFGNPEKNKSDKNAYVAHVAQSLNAMVLNKAFLRVFREIALSPAHGKHFKLCAQVHDSILFQFREGHEYLCELVRERMEIPVTVKSYAGPEYTFTVPAAIKAGADGLGVKYWSETE